MGEIYRKRTRQRIKDTHTQKWEKEREREKEKRLEKVERGNELAAGDMMSYQADLMKN